MPGVVSFPISGVIVRINAGGRRGERPQDDFARSQITQDAPAPEHRLAQGSVPEEGQALLSARVCI